MRKFEVKTVSWLGLNRHGQYATPETKGDFPYLTWSNRKVDAVKSTINTLSSALSDNNHIR